jgi:alkanesulfonate monooxygenase SsuD/methylene tetrahydromethanopterin reductase-like flavin-dependent oxidoreductase (luciferase family)
MFSGTRRGHCAGILLRFGILAGSPEQVCERLVLVVKGCKAGQRLAREDILESAHQVIDAVIQLECHPLGSRSACPFAVAGPIVQSCPK